MAAPLLIGIAGYLATPTATAHSDTASMVSRAEGQDRWRSYMIAAPAGSLHSAELPFADATITGSTGAGVVLPDGERVAFRGGESDKNGKTSDESRVTRTMKKGRVLAVTPIAPPKAFTAGSILERTSSLFVPPKELRHTAFIKPELEGDALKIALAFHEKMPKIPENAISPLLAKLITNEKADVLATAYAPPAPDYATESPFSSILREDEARGRFIPPVGDDDHLWASQPLPPRVFTAKEQRCLAEGIYFEARGESVEGQAAVAQVILNRVRNPHYPNTICGVVYQNDSWRNRCQFSFACDGRREFISSKRHWDIAEEVAMAVTAGKIWLAEVGSSTHYHATYVSPRWARTMERMERIGLHVFYRTYGGGWS
jgi:spore germination cell wall hydrolase CwlJ-like protein